MAAQQLQLVCDSSTYANFFAWASPLSAWMATILWTQTNDTGQVMFTGLNITACASGSGNGVYTYNTLTGLALAVGRVVTITGMTNAANNGTFVITAFTGTTFTVVNASAVTESGSTGVVTKGTTVPGAAAYFYEIWKPGDGLTAFYLKIEYGNFSGTNSPSFRVSVGTGTNGSGTLTGLITQLYTTAAQAVTPPSTTTQYECNFSGDAGRICLMMWRSAPSGTTQQFFGVERSVNSSGTYTSTHVTLAVAGSAPSNTGCGGQQSILFGVAVGLPSPTQATRTNGTTGGGFILRCALTGLNSSASLNGTIPLDTITPQVGTYDYNLTMVGGVMQADIAEGVTFTSSIYGTTRTYMPSKQGGFGGIGPGNFRYDTNTVMALCMRYD